MPQIRTRVGWNLPSHLHIPSSSPLGPLCTAQGWLMQFFVLRVEEEAGGRKVEAYQSSPGHLLSLMLIVYGSNLLWNVQQFQPGEEEHTCNLCISVCRSKTSTWRGVGLTDTKPMREHLRVERIPEWLLGVRSSIVSLPIVHPLGQVISSSWASFSLAVKQKISKIFFLLCLSMTLIQEEVDNCYYYLQTPQCNYFLQLF